MSSLNKIFSIITVTRNDLNGLIKTSNSVKSQSFKNYEHIIVDGGSTDGTTQFLYLNSNAFDVIISEKDDGIYDALNKGISIANGRWIIFLNSGDYFFNSEVLSFASKICINKDSLYFGRSQIFINESEKWVYPPYFVDDSNVALWLGKNLPNHQSIFFPAAFYKKNFYRRDIPISADSEYKERALKCCNSIFFNCIISIFEIGGLSSHPTLKNQLTLALNRFNRNDSPHKYHQFIFNSFKGFSRLILFYLFHNNGYLIIKLFKDKIDFLYILVMKLINK